MARTCARGHIVTGKRCKRCERRTSSRPELSRYAWQKLRAQAKRRDGHRCVVCGERKGISVHHRIPARAGGRDVLSNLVTLCARHHREADAKLENDFPGDFLGTTNPHPAPVSGEE